MSLPPDMVFSTQMHQRYPFRLRALVAVPIMLGGAALYAATLPGGGLLSTTAALAVLGCGVALAVMVTLIVRRADTRRDCPMCAERVKAAARVCRYCGHKFAD